MDEDGLPGFEYMSGHTFPFFQLPAVHRIGGGACGGDDIQLLVVGFAPAPEVGALNLQRDVDPVHQQPL